MGKLQFADRVRETTTTSGTGTVTLAGAQSGGYQTFNNGIGLGNQCDYCITDAANSTWEVGQGTVATSTTLSRDTVYASSNSNALVSFSSNSKDIFVTYPAKIVSVYPPGFAKGLGLSWNSTTQITVASGYAVDQNNAYNIVWGGGSVFTTLAGVSHMDNSTPAGTATFSTTAVTGSGTSFKTAFGTRAATGTVSSSSTTVTGTSSAFLSQFAINDLIGNSTLGYVKVTAIASDTSLTTNSALGASAGTSVNAIEQPLLQIGTNTVRRVTAIASNTALTLDGTPTGGSGTGLTIGGLFVGDGSTNAFYHVFVGSDGALTNEAVTAFISSQRTTPLNASTYPKYRRIGSVMADSSGNLTCFSSWGDNNHRFYRHEIAFNSTLIQVVAAGNPIAWTQYVCSPAIPPTAVALICMNDEGSTACVWSVRPANSGSSNATLTPLFVGANATFSCITLTTKCDAAQNIQAFHNVNAATFNLYIGGWEDLI